MCLFNEAVDRYYDWKNFRFKNDLLQLRLNTLASVVGFSRQFVEILSSMLQEAESTRPALNVLFNKFNVAKNTVNQQPILDNYNNNNYHDVQKEKNVKLYQINNKKNRIQHFQPKIQSIIHKTNHIITNHIKTNPIRPQNPEILITILALAPQTHKIQEVQQELLIITKVILQKKILISMLLQQKNITM